MSLSVHIPITGQHARSNKSCYTRRNSRFTVDASLKLNDINVASTRRDPGETIALIIWIILYSVGLATLGNNGMSLKSTSGPRALTDMRNCLSIIIKLLKPEGQSPLTVKYPFVDRETI